ncbi:MAG: DUF4321 domain-containing protein [Candidatus Latescibacteria bacterium]|nr:DUF4321 domain-containing protein [Candidatus Latescibacterota bacterium]
MRRKGLGLLIIALLVGVLAGNIVGGLFGILFQAVGISKDAVIGQVLVKPLFVYECAPTRLNVIVLTLTVGFTLNFNALSLLGMGIAWYYFKYA